MIGTELNSDNSFICRLLVNPLSSVWYSTDRSLFVSNPYLPGQYHVHHERKEPMWLPLAYDANTGYSVVNPTQFVLVFVLEHDIKNSALLRNYVLGMECFLYLFLWTYYR